MARFLLLFFYCFVLSVLNQVNGDDFSEMEVATVMNEVSHLLRQKHHIAKSEMDSFSIPNAALLDHDMRLTVSQAAMILETLQNEIGIATNSTMIEKRVSVSAKKWTFPIKYAFDGTHTDAEKDVIRRGINFWQSSTCVTFQEIASAPQIAATSSLTFTKGDGCSSYVGVSSSTTQPISLGDGCIIDGKVAHEVGHALGMYHEHMRPDRDSYIKIYFANTLNAEQFALFIVSQLPTLKRFDISQFAKVSSREDINYGCPYDFESVMHYDSLGLSIGYNNKKRVIEPLDQKMLTSMGNRNFLSFNDIKRINYHYNCIATSCSNIKLSQQCQNGGYQDPKNCAKCRCPAGWGGDFCTTNSPPSGSSTCGGIINMTACSTAIITSPNYPSPYPAKSRCSWIVQAPVGTSLVFGFETGPNMPCSFADTCTDFVEIQTNASDRTANGGKFCTCGQNSGRLYSSDQNQAVIYFASYSSSGSRGFRLNIYATCVGTVGSNLTKECILSSSGFDYVGSRETTDNGQTCAIWSGQNNIAGLKFPDGSLLNASRYCRNPDSRSSPWCYVGSSYNSVGYCKSFPKCPTGSNPVAMTTSPITTRRLSDPTEATPITSAGNCRATIAGRDYVGTVNVTVNGLPCQRWDNQWPHPHQFTNGKMFPDGMLWLVKNYCRNPDPTFNDGVWCFTQFANPVRELCDVPLCNGPKIADEETSKRDNNNLEERELMVISPKTWNRLLRKGSGNILV